jgi:hypothetical protein
VDQADARPAEGGRGATPSGDTPLERSPEYAQSVADALRTAAERSPAHDGSPPAAAPPEPHCRQEALRVAATGRLVDELVELSGRLLAERREHTVLSRTDAAPTLSAAEKEPETVGGPVGIRAARVVPARGTRWTRRTGGAAGERGPQRAMGSTPWESWLTAVALAVCAVAHFPLRRDGASIRVHALALALGLSVLCMLLALLLAVRPAALVLAVAVVVPAVLLAARVYGSAFPSKGMFRAVELALAPPWLAAASAVCASLLALTALVVRVASPFPGRRWATWPAPEVRRLAE